MTDLSRNCVEPHNLTDLLQSDLVHMLLCRVRFADFDFDSDERVRRLVDVYLSTGSSQEC